MKKKCIECNKARGKRGCKLHDNALICPRCCAEIRSQKCAECSYYKSAEIYNIEKYRKSGRNDFIIEINEEVEKSVDGALKLVESKRFDQAKSILTKLLKDHPKNHLVLYGMGVLLAYQDQGDEAIDYFKRATDIYPYFVEAHYNLGVAYKNKLDVSNMLKSLKKVIQIGDSEELCVKQAKDLIRTVEEGIRKTDGVDLDTFEKSQDEFERATILMEKKEWRKAIEGFEKSIRILDSHPQPYGNMGICYAKLGKKGQAMTAFDKALEIDPNYELAIVNKAATESLKEGEVSDGGVGITDYYKEYGMKNRSYIQTLFQEQDNRKNELK
jgi:tetratricopeptide (TPR) repeat protein